MSHRLDCCKTVKLIKHLGNVHKMPQVWFPFNSMLHAVWERTSQTSWLQRRRNTHSHTQTGLHNLCSTSKLSALSINSDYLPQKEHLIKLPSLTLQHWHCCVRVSTQNDHFWNVQQQLCLQKRAEHVICAEWMFLPLSNMNLICNTCSTRDQKGLWVPTQVSVELGHLGFFPMWTRVTKASDGRHLALSQTSKVLRFFVVKSSNAAHRVLVRDYKYNVLPLDFNMITF